MWGQTVRPPQKKGWLGWVFYVTSICLVMELYAMLRAGSMDFVGQKQVLLGSFRSSWGGGKLQKPRGSLFVINGSKDCSVQVTLAEGFFGLTFDDLMTFVATCKSCNAGLQHAVLLDLGLRWATIWRKMMPTLQTTFRHLVAMFVFFDIFSKTEFNSYVVCTAIWYWWWLLLWILIIWLIHWKKTTLTKGDFQSRRDWIYPWLLFPEAGICTIQQKTCTAHCYESSICLRWRNSFFFSIPVGIVFSSPKNHPDPSKFIRDILVECRFLYTFAWVFGTSAFVAVMCLPPWPMWNRHDCDGQSVFFFKSLMENYWEIVFYSFWQGLFVLESRIVFSMRVLVLWVSGILQDGAVLFCLMNIAFWKSELFFQ